mgnify:CR=1 FL=1
MATNNLITAAGMTYHPEHAKATIRAINLIRSSYGQLDPRVDLELIRWISHDGSQKWEIYLGDKCLGQCNPATARDIIAAVEQRGTTYGWHASIDQGSWPADERTVYRAIDTGKAVAALGNLYCQLA